ncbi:MAG: phosphate signaling complex protein PhoU [Ignavibacteria bacterium]
MERHFDHLLDKLKTKLIKMSTLVNGQVELALRSVEEGSHELAKLVIERDAKVDSYDLKVDKSALKLVALNQPVATDLRFIMSSVIINSNLERIGDIAVNIAENAEYFHEKPAFYHRISFHETAEASREMIRLAADAFTKNDPVTARQVMNYDNNLDELVKKNFELLIEIMKEDKANIEQAVKLYSIFHCLERLGDRAVNIAEYVYYIVEARIVKRRMAELPAIDEDTENEPKDESKPGNEEEKS